MKKTLISAMILSFAFAVAVDAIATTTVATTTTRTSTSTFNLTLSTLGHGAGKVSNDIKGTTPLGKTTKINRGSRVALTATPVEGSTFTGWLGACTGTAPCTITMNSNKTVIAIFTRNVNSLRAGEIKAVDAVCAKTAITKRDASLVAATQKYATDLVAAITAKSTAQKLAYDKTNAERTKALREVQTTNKNTVGGINSTLNISKQAASTLFRTELRACGVTDTNDTEDTD